MDILMDALERIFEIQGKHNKQWWDKERFLIDKVYRKEVAMAHCMGITEQNVSLMNSFDWKHHNIASAENLENSKEQAIDIIKYAIGMLIMLGVDSDDFFDQFINKSKMLDVRWKQDKVKFKDNKVVVFDLDGVICDWESSIVEFVAKKKGWSAEEVYNTRLGLLKRDSYSIGSWLGMDQAEDEDMKNEFIATGGFGDIIAYPGAINVMLDTQKLGIKVVCITSRPAWIHKRLFSDTYSWLINHDFEPDLLLFNKDKAEAIIDNVLPANILCAVDDRDKHAFELAHLGIMVFVPFRPHNQNLQPTKNIVKFSKWKQYYEYVYCRK